MLNNNKLSVNLVKQHHKKLVIESLLSDSVMTRTQIARKLSISNATVGTIIDELLTEKIVIEEKDESSTFGRKPKIINIKKDTAFNMLINLTVKDSISCVISNIHGEVVLSSTSSVDETYESSIMNFLSSIRDTMRDRTILSKLHGICVSIPGGHVKKEDIIVSNIIEELEDIPLKKIIKNYFDTPVFIENDINLATRSYLAKEKPNKGNYLFIYLGSGVGGSIVLDGKLYEGFSGYSGSLGQTFIDEKTTLEQVTSSDVFYQKMSEYFKTDDKDELHCLIHNNYMSNNEFVLNAIGTITNVLAYSISNLMFTLNPEVTYLFGHYNVFGDKFIDDLTKKTLNMISSSLKDNSRLSEHFKKYISIKFADNNNFDLAVGAHKLTVEHWIDTISSK